MGGIAAADLSRVMNSNHFSRLKGLMDEYMVSDKMVFHGQRDEQQLWVDSVFTLPTLANYHHANYVFCWSVHIWFLIVPQEDCPYNIPRFASRFYYYEGENVSALASDHDGPSQPTQIQFFGVFFLTHKKHMSILVDCFIFL